MAIETKEANTASSEELSLSGLSTLEARALIEKGICNKSDIKAGKSYLKIVCDNLFTFFNMIWVIVTAVLIAVGSYSNLTFLAIVIPNTLIAMIQEIRAKRTVEKLSLTTDPIAVVVRDGVRQDIFSSDIVPGDIMYLELGRQVLSDGVVVEGTAEVNESMLTGESCAIKKLPGDKVMAGSYLVSGSVYARTVAVGKDNYIHKIEKAARNFKAPSSNLFKELSALIRYISVILVPMAALLFFNNYRANSGDLVKTVETTCASIIGMIPSGVFLLVTLTLSLSVVTLGRKGSLVRDMYSIEMLASADVICLDKTGTITDGTMTVSALEIFDDYTEAYINRIMAKIEGAESAVNNTSAALIEKFGKDESAQIIESVPFSSARKYSAVNIKDEGCFSVGAAGFVNCPITDKVRERIDYYASLGERVVLLVKMPSLEEEGRAVALIAISDRIRPNAFDTIANFQEQGVTVKVISGDHAGTVSSIAKKVGIIGAEKYISCESLSDEELAEAADKYAIFGRVTPEQKILLVKTLRSKGHTVAMTGDGVNDTLALKESDCSIAMADGSEVARKVAKIVLMNSDFGVLPDIVKEGRRCINNVRMSSVLYLMKTLFTFSLSVLSLITLSGYPFAPKQLLFIEMIIIGLASLMLSVEPNFKRAWGSYMAAVIKRSVPNAIIMIIPVFLVQMIGKSDTYSNESVSAIATLAVTLAAFMNLVFLCKPYTEWRVGVISICAALLAITIPASIVLLGDVIHLRPAFDNLTLMIIILSITLVCSVLIHFGARHVKKRYYKNKQKKKSIST